MSNTFSVSLVELSSQLSQYAQFSGLPQFSNPAQLFGLPTGSYSSKVNMA